MKIAKCELCGATAYPFDLVPLLFTVLACPDCIDKLNQPIRLDGCVTAGSWQSIVDAHMQAHDQWRSRMVQLAKDICGSA